MDPVNNVVTVNVDEGTVFLVAKILQHERGNVHPSAEDAKDAIIRAISEMKTPKGFFAKGELKK